MPKRRNGVDDAIALILALIRHSGAAPTAILVTECGIARSSLNRICRALAAERVVTLSRGRVTCGPVARQLLERHRAALARDDLQARLRGAQSRTRAPGSDIRLSAPLARGPRRRFRIGFSNASLDNHWRVALVHAVEHAAAELGDDIERLIVRHAGDDATQQAADIAAMVADGVDGLIVSAVDAAITGEAVARAMADGVAVVLVDRGVATDTPHISFVSTDDAALGRTTALWLAERMAGTGGLLMLPGLAGAEPARQRHAAALAVFGRFPGIALLGETWTGWHRDTAHHAVREAIGRWGGGIAGVWCDSGLQGVGSLAAFAEADWPAGTIPPHTGGDLNLAYKLAIKHRVPLAAVDYPPAMGRKAVEVLFASLSGKWVPASVAVASEIILTRGHGTRSVKADIVAEDHVRWDLPDDLILASGMGPAYNPRSFRIHYPGNVYNRSAARQGGRP